MRKNELKDQSGFTLIELMVAAGVSVVILFALGAYLTSAYRTLQQQRVLSLRNRLALSLTRIGGMDAALRYSIYQHVENDALKACITWSCDGSGATCTLACDGSPTAQQPFRLYGPFVNLTTGSTIETSGAVTGVRTPAGQAMYYSLNGESCDPTTSPVPCNPDSYPVMVTTEFRGVCSPLWSQRWNPLRSSDSVWDKSNWDYMTPVFPQGFNSPDKCLPYEDIDVVMTFEPTPGQTGNPLLGTLVSFPPLKTHSIIGTMRPAGSFGSSDNID